MSAFSFGDTLFARGPMDIYEGSGQILIGYQEDIYKPGGGVVGDGTGFTIIEPDTISPGRTNVDLKLSIW